MLSSVWAWRDVAVRWQSLGIDFSAGQTCVEGGFKALREAMLLHTQTTVSEATFLRAGRRAMLHLNYHLLHRHHLPAFTQGDARVLRVLDELRMRVLRRAHHQTDVIADAEQRFTRALADL